MKALFLDLETTGLDSTRDVILEVGAILYDIKEEKEIFRASWLMATEVRARFSEMARVVYEMHEKSGLLAELDLGGPHGTLDVERELLELLYSFGVKPGELVLAGFTPHFDRAFLRRYMSALNAYLHYRHLDVSTLRTLEKAWLGENPPKVDKHRALPDCEEAIAELLRFKRTYAGLIAPTPDKDRKEGPYR